jgi:parallel beta-helix repeat protein
MTSRRPPRRPSFRPAVEHLEERLQLSTNYFVATNGLDSNPGTMTSPFATLNRAAQAAAPGDTVNVRGGTYLLQQPQWLGNSGTAAARIVFQSYPGETAILDGSQLPANTDALSIGGQYVDLKGFEVRNATHNGIVVWGGSHDRILNDVVHDNQYSGIYSGYSSPNVVSDITVDGNTVYHNALMNSAKTLASWPAALVGQRVANYTVTNNTVYDNYGEGIDFVLGDGGLASGNTLHDNYSVEMYLDNASHVTLQQNLIYTTNDPTYYRSWGAVTGPAASFQVANETYSDSNPCDHDTIINNIAIGGHWNFRYGNYKSGGGLRDFVVANNTFYSASGSMLSIDADAGHTNTVFSNNLFYQTNGHPMVQFNGTAGLSNLSFSYNLWYGGSAGPAAGPGDVNANPLLANPGGTQATDYRLLGNSPAIDTGVTVPAVTTDYFGTGRPQGVAYDIGAYEYVPVPSTLTISGFASPSTAGVSGSFTVTARDAFGRLATGYLGTVHFTSSDGQAGLPGDYTFTAADKGAHTFTVTLKTAGTQTVTAADTGTAGLNGTATVAVNPAAASRLSVSAPSGSTAGSAFSITVKALDPYGNTATGYTGTVHFTGSDGRATLPANYPFTPTDRGVHTFTAGVTFRTAGSQTVTAADTVTGAVSGTAGVTVSPAALDHFDLIAPGSAMAGMAFSITVAAKDIYGNTLTNFTGTVHFTSSDPGATLPGDYAFTAADQGVHTFNNGVRLRHAGSRTTITVSLLSSSSIQGTASITVESLFAY